jgi:hypothetical protein
MSGGVGSRVGGGVAMVEELGERCLRQPRIGACREKRAVEVRVRGGESRGETKCF